MEYETANKTTFVYQKNQVQKFILLGTLNSLFLVIPSFSCFIPHLYQTKAPTKLCVKSAVKVHTSKMAGSIRGYLRIRTKSYAKHGNPRIVYVFGVQNSLFDTICALYCPLNFE